MASLPPCVINYLMLPSSPQYLHIFQLLRLQAMKETSAQSLTLTQKYPERGMEEKTVGTLKKKKRRTERNTQGDKMKESNRIALVITLSISPTHIEIKIERGREGDGDGESHYCTQMSCILPPFLLPRGLPCSD